MERYEIVVDDEGNYCGLIPSENGSVVKYADAQATVEALQRELLEWKRALCNLTPGGSEFADDHAYCAEWVHKVRENQHDIIISKHRELKATQATLDAEREKVKGLHEITKVVCTHCCEPMEIPSKAVLQTKLSQLQALVRAYINARREAHATSEDEDTESGRVAAFKEASRKLDNLRDRYMTTNETDLNDFERWLAQAAQDEKPTKEDL